MFERLLFERIETRVMVGITVFVGIMLLVGWVAINEQARMATFERQFLARSIERGAELFAANCATCHGEEGRGKVERAPALNNPQLFGYDYLAVYDRQISALNFEEATLIDQRQKLVDELVATGTSDARKAEIETELESITARLDSSNADSIPVERDALAEQRQTVMDQMLNAVDLGYNPEDPSRLVNLGWGGTLEAFVFTTLKSGRPVSSSYWPQPMAAWSQTAGGPLRDDQLQDLTNYILNWDKGSDWTLDDVLAIQQFAKVPGESGGPPSDFEAAGTDTAAVIAKIEADGIVGDVARGDQLYHGQTRTTGGVRLPCAGCHQGGVAAPATEGTWTRIQNERLTMAEFAGYTAEQYLIESIIHSQAFVVPGQPNNMPETFGGQLNVQDLADIVAFLMTQQ